MYVIYTLLLFHYTTTNPTKPTIKQQQQAFIIYKLCMLAIPTLKTDLKCVKTLVCVCYKDRVLVHTH